MSNWAQVALGDVAEELTVGFVGSMTSQYVKEGVPFLRSQDILPYRIDFSDIKYISPEFNEQIRKSQLYPGDVVVVRTGKPGTAAVVPEDIGPLNCSDLVIIRPGKNLDSDFLCYYINTVATGHVNAHLVGAVQQHFNVGSARQLKLHFPAPDIQRHIAAILSAFDDKIELNRRMNRTLEQMARALFRSWFVDFDPVRAKMRGETPEGMDAETAALFPDKMEDEVPRGWIRKTVGELYRLHGGSTPSTANPAFWEGGEFHWTTPKDLSGLDVPFLTSTEKRITEAGTRVISSGVLPAGTVLLSSRAPVGYLAIAAMPVSINQGYVALEPIGPLQRYFTLNLLQERLDEVKAMASGTTFPELSKKTFHTLDVLVPPKLLCAAFERTVGGMYDTVLNNVRESTRLAQLRDVLLPRLLSGEVDVSGWANSSSKTMEGIR